MTDLVVPVVVEGWQYECCGEPPAVGDRVAWRLVLQQPAWGEAAVDLPVTVEPLPAEEREEWRRLGNDPGPEPVLARVDGLTVFVADGGRLFGRAAPRCPAGGPARGRAHRGPSTRGSRASGW